MAKVSQMESEASPRDENHSERIGKLEGITGQLLHSMEDLANSQKKMWDGFNDLSGKIGEVVTSSKAVKGMWDSKVLIQFLGLALTTIGLIMLAGGALIGLYLNPMAYQISADRTDSLRRDAAMQEIISESFKKVEAQILSINEHGSPALREQNVKFEKDIAATNATIEDIKVNGSQITRDRLKELEVIQRLQMEGRLK